MPRANFRECPWCYGYVDNYYTCPLCGDNPHGITNELHAAFILIADDVEVWRTQQRYDRVRDMLEELHEDVGG